MSWRVNISETLVAEAQRKERHAVERVVQELTGPVYNLAMRFFGDPTDAEDESQNALLHVVQVLPKYEGRSRFSTWCYRVVVNRFLNARRKKQEAMTVEIGSAALAEGLRYEENEGPYLGPDAELLAEEVKLSCTSALLLCLSRPLRLAYILGEILDFSTAEAAAVLEIRPQTFRKRLSLARKEVRSFLAPRCGWVDSANACRCARQVGYDVKVGWVERGNLKYAGDKRITEHAKNRLSGIFDEASLYRSHPQYAASAHLQTTLRRALQTLDDLGRDLEPKQ